MNDQPDQNNNDNQPPVPPVEPVTPPTSDQPQQPVPPAPQTYPGQPGVQYAQPMENPGQTTGIVGLVLNFLGITIGGIILGAISRNKSKAAGMSTTLGTISLVWGIIATVIGAIVITLMIIGIILAASESSTRPRSSDSLNNSYEYSNGLEYEGGVRR